MSKLTVKIVDQNTEETYQNVSSLTLPTPQGYITVLPGHDKLLTVLSKGTIKIKTSNKVHTLNTIGGICKISQNNVIILLD